MVRKISSIAAGVALASVGAGAALAVEVSGVGWEGAGADLVVLQLDGDPRPDMILMAYDNPAQANSFRYRVGLNLDAQGVAAQWRPGYETVAGLGWEGQGAGLATADLDGNGRPELIVMAYDAPAQANNFRYRVGWNLDNQGRSSNWTSHAQVAGLGWEGQGAAAMIGQIDADPRPDMVFMAYDNPSGANSFRYRVGFNVDGQGNAGWSSSWIEVPGVGWEGAGAAGLITQIDGDPRPDMVLMAYDDPAQANSFRYRIGLNLNAQGIAAQWQPGYQTIAGLGWEGQGAGLAEGCLDGDPRGDWIFMAYDNPSGANSFRYTVSAARSVAQCAAQPASPPRKSVTALTPQELQSLRNGFAQMIAWNTAPRNSANFRRSLRYWADIHAYFGTCYSTQGLNNLGMSGMQSETASNAGESATWCTCEHGDPQFLTWHRMYLYYFEQALQAAAGDPQLRLPYWDYAADGSMPAALRGQTYVNQQGQTQPNPLYVPNRHSGINAGTNSLSGTVTSASIAMNQSSYGPFNDQLESQPHSGVHCALSVAGCGAGYMGHPASAGHDPVFYMHHANIDRLYECWLRVNETARLPGPSLRTASYSFPDGSGTVVSRQVGDMLTTSQLNYRYAGGSGCPGGGSGMSGLAELVRFQGLELLVEPRVLADLRTLESVAPPTRLERGTTVVPLAVEAPAERALFMLREVPVRSQIVLRGFDFDETPQAIYIVYLEDREGRREQIGSISFFSRGRHGGHHGEAEEDVIVFDGTEALARLGPAGSLSLVFEPSTGLADSTPEAAARRIQPDANVRFEGVSIELLPEGGPSFPQE